MTEVLHFTGFIRGVSYRTYLTQELKEISLDNFDVNKVNTFGLIKSPDTEIAYSQWVSPKRTRSYPFARMYNTYNSSKVITIIPVIKDEGSDGDRDRIQYSTISWMNLLNIYIVLAYYETADKSTKKGQGNKQKLTKQQFNSEFVKSQIDEILTYRQSALHWNKNLFEERFTEIFEKALDCYDSISQTTGVSIHSRQGMDSYLQKIIDEFEEFKNISLKGSQSASKREALTSHKLEYLVDGLKATFSIENYLGGVYYLTPDEIFHENDTYIIQESKNTSKESLPKLPDIQDGLFKLILFSNLDSLTLNGQPVSFITSVDVNKLSDFDRAVRFFVLNRITFSGTVESGGFSEQAFHKRFTYSSIDRLEKLEQILTADVKITNLDYSELLKSEQENMCVVDLQHKTVREEKDIFIFLDPPYFAATKSRLYGKDGDLHTCFDHQRFASLVMNCPLHWLITYDDSPYIRENFKSAQIREWELH